jgi:hypothetical protein
VQTLRKQYDSALADFAAARQLNPEAPQVSVFRCIAYTEMGKSMKRWPIATRCLPDTRRRSTP